jgi:hypothetical protein
MGYVFLEFIFKWIEKGRLPREELRVRRSIAIAGLAVVLILAVALIATWLS